MRQTPNLLPLSNHLAKIAQIKELSKLFCLKLSKEESIKLKKKNIQINRKFFVWIMAKLLYFCISFFSG